MNMVDLKLALHETFKPYPYIISYFHQNKSIKNNLISEEDIKEIIISKNLKLGKKDEDSEEDEDADEKIYAKVRCSAEFSKEDI